MTTVPATENKALDQVKSKAQQRFEASLVTANQFKTLVDSITISDETTLQMANQALSKIKEHYNLTEEKRVTMKAPYLEITKAIDGTAKQVLDILKSCLDKGKEKLGEWNTAVEKKRQEQINAATELKGRLDRLVLQISEKADKCVTPKLCQDLIDSINEKFPLPEAFGAYSKEAAAEKSRYIDLLTKKKDTIAAAIKGESGSTAKLEDLQKTETAAATDTANMQVATAQKAEEIIDAANDNAVKSNVRKTWVGEVIDPAKVPVAWMSIDQKKIDAYAKEIKESAAGKEQILSGVRFYLKETVIIK